MSSNISLALPVFQGYTYRVEDGCVAIFLQPETLQGARVYGATQDVLALNISEAIRFHRECGILNVPKVGVKAMRLAAIPSEGVEAMFCIQMEHGTFNVYGSSLDSFIEEQLLRQSPEGKALEARREAERSERERLNEEERKKAMARQLEVEEELKRFSEWAGHARLEAGKAASVLRKQFRFSEYGGAVMSRMEWVRLKVSKGAVVTETSENRLSGPTRLQAHRMDGNELAQRMRRVKEAGQKKSWWLDGFGITAAEAGYARFLGEKAGQ